MQNAPLGLTFPVDLTGNTIVVSIEPPPDNSAAPFQLKPLVTETLAGAMPMEVRHEQHGFIHIAQRNRYKIEIYTLLIQIIKRLLFRSGLF